MTRFVALATFGMLALLSTTLAAAAEEEAPALFRSPFIAAPPLVTDTAEQIAHRTADLTDFPTVLDPRIWQPDHSMRPEITARTIAIVNRLFGALRLRNKAVSVADIELFGSNASLEYDEQADIGIHVFLSTARNPTAYAEDVTDLDRFMKLFTDTIELEQRGEVSFYGIPLEIVFHAVRPQGYRDAAGLPQYSIWSSDPSRTGQWINPRSPPPDPPRNAFDRNVIIAKAGEFAAQYNALAAEYFKDKRAFDCTRFDGLEKSMKAYRSAGIAQDGQRSNGNLTYRLLRRLSISVPDTNEALERECLNIKDSLF